jgi:hypothetical protein
LITKWLCMCPDCFRKMQPISENVFLCECGKKVVQLSIYDEGERQNGAIKSDEEANEG